MNVRILTISDIHYKSIYDTDKLVIKYLDSFAKAIIDIDAAKPIDLIVLSGDIAFSGESNDYKHFLNKFRTLVPQVPIYSIVGNHDVNWTFLNKALGEDRKLEELYNTDIGEELQNPSSPFINVFKDFENHFRTDCNQKMKNQALTEKFCNKTYSGYVWDENNKLLILLLNSAWKSFGPGVIGAYYDKLVKDKDKGLDKVKEEIKKMIMGDELSQEGKQTYAYKFFPYRNEVNDIINEHPTCKVLTFAHHPPSWLEWKEHFENSEKEEGNLDVLTGISQILITGHLHNPFKRVDILNGQCYHLSNAAFLDYHFVDKVNVINPITKFPNNWFTVIDLGESNIIYSAYNFKVKEIKTPGINYEYLWDKSVEERLPYILKESVTQNPPVLEPFIKMPNTLGQVINKVITTTPITAGNLIESFRKARLVEFRLTPTATIGLQDDIKQKAFYELENEDELYIVSVNSLEWFHECLRDSPDFKTLIATAPGLKALYELVKKSVKLPVVGFYDFVELGVLSEQKLEDFRIFENKQFALYQSFKHLFFAKFEELYNFKELSIVYDCIIVNGP